MSGKVNEIGRQPGDPSVELMRLLGMLQRTQVKDEIVELEEPLYSEAVDFLVNHPSTKAIINYPGRPDVYMLCRHWIGPACKLAA
jgi:hypothetical protein